MDEPIGQGSPPAAGKLVETRSIDYVPTAERHGKAWHLGPIWFVANAQLSTVATGLVGIAAGGTLIWTLVALVLGLAFGTFFMAFHSVQGPRMGLPQMIQSRPQFGYVGSILPLAVVLCLYVGFNVFNVILAAQALQFVVNVSLTALIAAVVVLALVLAVVGYDWIHKVQRWFSYLFLAGFGLFTVGVIVTLHPAGHVVSGGFSAVPFFLQFAVAASYQITLAPYVSDYSRYLPADTSSRLTFWWTYAPSLIAGLWLAGVGAFLQAANPKLEPVAAIHAAGNSVFAGLGVIGLLAAIPGTISITAMNTYGGGLCIISMIDSLRAIRPTTRLRVAAATVAAVAGFILAKTLSANVLTNFGNFLTLLLYFMIPWTAVNLADFYIVRKGHYALQEIFKPTGIYGRWGWRGLIAYVVGLGAMVPFFSTSLYTGPVATSLSGVDISIFIGLPVASVLYVVLCRNLDLGAEQRIAALGRDDLERISLRHELPAVEPGYVGVSK